MMVVKRGVSLCGLLACTLVSSGVSAVITPTSFLAQEKPLKKGLAASDTVTATLYSDPSCTTFVASQTIAIESVEVRERMKPLKIEAAVVKPQKGVWLHFTFSPASIPTGGLYLAVTSGVAGAVVGIPSDCQQQSAETNASDLTCASCVGSGELAPDVIADYVMPFGGNVNVDVEYLLANGTCVLSGLPSSVSGVTASTVPKSGTITRFAWNSANGVARDSFGVWVDGSLAATVVVPGQSGDSPLSIGVSAGQAVEVLASSGAPNQTVVLLWIE